MPTPKKGRVPSSASGGDGRGGDGRVLLAFGVGFSYQLGLDEPPQSSKGGGEDGGKNRSEEVGRWRERQKRDREGSEQPLFRKTTTLSSVQRKIMHFFV